MKNIVLSILPLLLVNSASAGEWTLTPEFSPTLKYDDNVFMSEDEEGSFEFLVKPALTGRYALENSETTLSVGYAIQKYFSLSVNTFPDEQELVCNPF